MKPAHHIAQSAALLALVVAVASSACNRHDVPLGGDCDKGEDCGPAALTCYKAPGRERGYCSQTCAVAPPSGVVPGGPGCESAKMVCKRAATAHPILGEEFCVKP